MFTRIRFKSLRSWLTLWFLVLALLPIIVVSIIVYIQRVDVIRAHRIDSLEAIRDLKVRQVEDWVAERLGDGQLVARSQEISDLIRILDNEQSTEFKHEYSEAARTLLNRYMEGFKSYSELFLLDRANGRVLVSTNSSDEGNLKADYPYFAETLEKRETVISDIYFSKTLRQPSMVVSTPIFDREQETKIIAILVARIDLENTIYDLLLDRTGLGETGETLIVDKEGYALNELRWHENAPLNLKISATPAQLAMQGHKGTVEEKDYRGVQVVAAYSYIPQIGWGFISKQDSTEVFSSIQSMLYSISILVGTFSGIIILCAFAIAKKVTAPIQAMKGVSSLLQSGDLTARNSTERSDELGFLAQSFNELADSIEAKINIQNGNNAIFKSIIASESLQEFSQALLKKMLEITDSRLAAFYLRSSDGTSFDVLTSIGTGPASLQAFNAASLEGELGVVLASKQIECITDIPADTRFTFNAVAGQVVPREIITIPLLDRGEVKAVVSLASLNSYSAECQEILRMCWLPVSSALVNIMANEKTQRMASELAEKNEELQANTEELQSQSEELREQADELRSTASELESRRNQVEDADRLKSEFLSNMSHELRTPLNSVLALSQLMISRGTGKDPSEEKNFLEVIERNGRQLLNLINDILDLAKIESGRMDISSSVFDVNQTVQRALGTIRPLAEEKNLLIALKLDKLPTIESDEEKLNQILLNLLSNAVKFTDQGEITLNVSATSQTLRCEVSDTGIGIAPKELPHIFDEFRQADGTTTRKHEGTGLGLAICQKLAQLLGGQIQVKSTLDQGSTFTFELPLKTSSATIHSGREESIMTSPNAGKLPGRSMQRTILVIEDELDARNVLAEHLQSSGYDVIVASNGKQGMLLAKKHRPFAITLDILMPDMDGWEVLRGIKDHPQTADIPVIILSVSEDRATGMALGATDFLTKPINEKLLSELVATLQQYELGALTSTAPAQPNILVVEDNETAALQVQMALEENGYCVTLACDGAEGLASVNRSVPDGMVLDLMMPGVDGFEVLETIRSTPWTEKLPVLILTAKELTAQDRARLKYNNVHQLIQKGAIDKAQLLSAIRTMIEPLQVRMESEPKQPQLNLSLSANRTVLVVEDNPDNMFTISSILANEDCVIIAAVDGKQGVAMAEKERPGLILMDMQLPVMSGMEATQKIKGNPLLAKIPIIAVTASAMKGNREKMLSLGCDDYLSKPFDPSELQEIVRKWLK